MLQQIKMLVLGIITLCRRALCCFSRRRKLSHGSGASSAGDQLQAVNVIVERGDFATVPGATGYNGQPVGGRGGGAGAKERDWNSWDDSPRTVEEHIEQYRQRMAQPPTPPKEEPEPDFFSELTPTIKPQVKYYLDEGNTNASASQPSDFSRLQAQDLVPISNNADLEDWVDDNAGGWEELDTSQTKQILREKRRELRHQRQPAHRPAPPTVGAQRLSDVQRVA
ncbi:receptor-binding cancer antigen expressed on SiSo cells [Drosophila bipectinata]|uniref:receptor-binding cancer antigen expressed on SiSo cells n=1 Tax=Drosophila bipectinata TaxID=42026 RepID=UPI001C89005A|nr:receptor-binding cancer antigen expressed on SiSo cells [Drosophila bipectinata]